jgi:replicative DNA helicase
MKSNIFSPEFMCDWMVSQQKPVSAIPTHLPTLNRVMRDDGGGKGIAKTAGWLVVIGGSPGFGKSAFSLNLASAALNASPPEPVSFISLEMSATQLATRLYSLHSGTALRLLEKGGFSELAWHDTYQKFSDLPPVWVPNRLVTGWSHIMSYVQKCHDAGCRYFILDHLQCVVLGDDEVLHRGIQKVISELRAWAVESESAIVICSQFNRATSSVMETPRSTGLFGGHSIESHADVICLLDHSRYRREGNTAKTWLCVTKNRHGPCLEIPVEWDYRTLAQREADPSEEDSWPT